MKKSSLSLLAGCIFALSANAQTNSGGIYLTAADYSAGKICYAHTTKGKLISSDDDLLNSRHLVIDRAGVQTRICPKDVYAVKCSDGRIVRMYKDGCYTLLDPGGAVCIYKVTVYGAAKGDAARDKYYFSKDAFSGIENLTLDNLKVAYQDNRRFGDALDTQFRTDNELYAFDKAHHCYKLNEVYAMNN